MTAIPALVDNLRLWSDYRSGLNVPRWMSSVVRHNLAEAASLIESLHADRDLLVRALREYAADRSDVDIAFDFDAPGARLHERLRRILSEVPSASASASDDTAGDHRTVTDALSTLDAIHRPDPWADQCLTCGPEGGRWPCASAEVADDLRDAVGEGGR